MAPLAATRIERRVAPRCAIAMTAWRREALLRPGVPVDLLNISTRAVLVESSTWLRPGVRTELQLVSGSRRTSVRAQLDRCYVAALAPLRYRGVLIFENPLSVDIADMGSG